MKRITILLLAAILVPALAGNLSAQLPSFGVKGGVNMAKYTGSDAGTNDMKMGAVGGVFACVNLIAFKVQPELLFSQKGAKKEQTGGGTTYTYSTTQNYLEVPVLLKYSFGAIVVPSIYIGPSFGMLVSATAKTSGGSNSGSGDIKNYLNGTDIGLVLGAEVKTPVKLSVEARYTMGLTNVDKASAIGQSNIKNSTISVMLGYYLF
jgi:outer membrane immunogenic protein